ncbi:MAG: hypothetical protein LBN05_07975 [Oscillospiraceae bacterium]|jgi:hypothetical protein|nr:hypothetical protein [Oscillospiraceae bacterium]
MADFRTISLPAEDYEAWDATPDSVIQSSLNGNGDLVLHIVGDEDLEDFTCDGDCETCPVAGTDCDGDCFGCPCFTHCDESAGVCQFHGSRRDEL